MSHQPSTMSATSASIGTEIAFESVRPVDQADVMRATFILTLRYGMDDTGTSWTGPHDSPAEYTRLPLHFVRSDPRERERELYATTIKSDSLCSYSPILFNLSIRNHTNFPTLKTDCCRRQ